MREISALQVTEKIKELCLKANYDIGADVEKAVQQAMETEPSPAGRSVLCQLCENYKIAREERVAICQDTGMAVFFIDVGQEVHFIGGDFEEAVQEGVRKAYAEGYLRKSVVADPLFDRKNTGDNTPSILHIRLVPGDQVHILMTAKGFGSENMSAVKMLVPADGEQGVLDFIVETARKAGPNPCPPMVIGVGIGGTLEQAALLAKRMTARAIGSHHPDPRYAALEEKALCAVNRLGIGPAGIGGETTALAVNIASHPTHIAGMPVAINICCHAARHAEGIL
ncbi:MAG: fumarate hydratase [Clostridiales bacterium]|nr:fumarate hydratase [Clostridiales bacterium]